MKTVSDITKILLKLAPQRYTMDWDNSGIQIGDSRSQVNKIMVALDVTGEVMQEAIANDIDLLITHHPLLFNSVNKITPNDVTGKIIYQAIENNITIFSQHTNLDIAPGGLNDFLAEKLKLKDVSPLVPTDNEQFFKLVVFVPANHLEDFRQKILNFGAGRNGNNYSHCSFVVNGQGSFLPQEGSTPFSGDIGELNLVDEYRLETIIPKTLKNRIISFITENHPYEEPVWDIYPLMDEYKKRGIGRVGFLEENLKVTEFLQQLVRILNLEELKYTVTKNQQQIRIKKVAFCSGSGGDYIGEAAKQGADVYITGDVKYHQAREAQQRGLLLIDGGHYATEIIVKELFLDILQNELSEIDIIVASGDSSPWAIQE